MNQSKCFCVTSVNKYKKLAQSSQNFISSHTLRENEANALAIARCI